MGALFRTDDDGNHIATGKYPFVAGMTHVPVWGEWRNEGPMEMRSCEWGGTDCDLDEYRSYPT